MADKKLRVGFIGTGSIAQVAHFPVAAANPNVEIFYSGLNTAKLECKNNEITVTLFDPVY